MAKKLTLLEVLELGLNTDGGGTVRIGPLKAVLRALLEKADLKDLETEIDVSDEILAQQPKAKSAEVPSVTNGSIGAANGGYTGEKPEKTDFTSDLTSKIKNLEKQLNILYALPSNDQLLQSLHLEQPADQKSGQVAYMFQLMKVQKTSQTNTEAIDKLMSLMDDVIRDLASAKGKLERMNNDLAKLSQLDALKDILDKLKAFEETLTKKQDGLSEELKNLLARLNEFAMRSELGGYVSWGALEEALKGLKKDIGDLKKPPQVLIERDTMTSRPTTPPGPTRELIEALERIGKLCDQYDLMERRIAAIEEELRKKANKEDLDAIKIPDLTNLIKQLNEMKRIIEDVRNVQDRDSTILTRLQEIVDLVQEEIGRLKDTSAKLIENDLAKTHSIDELFRTTKDHEDRKADKEYVQTEIAPKADKNSLDAKVSVNVFDATTGELNKMINDLLGKLSMSEDELKKLLDQLMEMVSGKLERAELDALRKWVEGKLKQLQKLLGSGHDAKLSDEAAGIRKQLIARFHCISCDRPLEIRMQTEQLGQTLPEAPALPASRSFRPYTTYELDMIRQHTKSSMSSDLIDVYQQARQSGGSHTTTMPHKRIKQVTSLSQTFDEQTESLLQRLYRGESELVGSDGRLYRGRFDLRDIGMSDSVRLPEVPANNNSTVAAGGGKVSKVRTSNPPGLRVQSARSGRADESLKQPSLTIINADDHDRENTEETVRKPSSPIQP